ncbi:uncharacterized protein [Amphiura filiformis]|uniref:uncharacterized protein n=1 Tax=Amphiura filiformis TaxID=82378 RepID=UPI003B2106B7
MFSNVREIHGQSTVKKLRDLENCERKIANHRNHVVFSLRCRDLSLTPPSLKFKCPINTRKAKNIVNKAQRELLRERIRVTYNKLVNLKDKQSSLEQEINNEIPAESELTIQSSSHIARVRESTFEKSKCRQMRKLQILKEKSVNIDQKCRFTTPELDFSGTQLKKWVVNLSQYKLSKSENSVLAKGLNFAVSPTNVCTEEFVLATELACRNLPNSEAVQLRAKVASTLSSSKPPKSNISKDERKAIKDLKKVDSVIILPADKGKPRLCLTKRNMNRKLTPC